MMTPEEIKDLLFRRNYYLDDGISRRDLNLITLTSPETVEALRKYKSNHMADYERFAREIYQEIDLDGVVDPAMGDLLEMPRCDFPDYLPSRSGEANWPTACRGNLKFGRNFPKLPGLSQADTDKVYHAVVNNWTHALTDVVMDNSGVVSSQTGLQIYARLKALAGSTLAWSYLANNNCGTTLQQAYNTRTNWSQMSLPVTTATHEVGHALGLSHNRDSGALMYPSINSASRGRLGYPNETDLAQCRQIGYTLSGLPRPDEDTLYLPRGEEPDDPEDPVDPTDPSPTPRVTFPINAQCHIDGKYVGDVELRFKPRFRI